MTAFGIDSCSLVSRYVERHFGDTVRGVAASRRHASSLINWHGAAGRSQETGQPL